MIRALTCAVILISGAAFAQTEMTEIDRPASELSQVLAHPLDMPEGELEVRVVRAMIEPRTIAAWHTHPSPVYLYIAKGTLTMELEGQERRQVAAGEAIAEPLNSPMRVINESDEPVEVIVFQISPPKSEFLQ
ncbi:cupin domain-containing protein [Aurantimonas sp. C2-6-R+9]|uniref:cupin domain-containing protein n=1 Tax=unclassified Aurantimonas TaxID=2638230 RepID=UPI002E19110F|nr:MULTISPECIES: cupin domain-containing protein [unclassified Aurantimonas]MEC5293162.1 cupin domain-containing protein [Aurantimonas sp. C2-3-R2]MEC5383971.1 cupin domain-containing protein [Aurantimonas sp. C2-6-R+9]MEC5414240.1 cupin domain-containing protein [Aurantimonas sp. C2-4-R8]